MWALEKVPFRGSNSISRKTPCLVYPMTCRSTWSIVSLWTTAILGDIINKCQSISFLRDLQFVPRLLGYNPKGDDLKDLNFLMN